MSLILQKIALSQYSRLEDVQLSILYLYRGGVGDAISN